MLIKNSTDKNISVKTDQKEVFILNPFQQEELQIKNRQSLCFTFLENNRIVKKRGYAVAILDLQAELFVETFNNDIILNLISESITPVNDVKVSLLKVQTNITEGLNVRYEVSKESFDDLLKEKEKFDQSNNYKLDMIHSVFETIPFILIAKRINFFGDQIFVVTSIIIALLYVFIVFLNFLYTYFSNKKQKQRFRLELEQILSNEYLRECTDPLSFSAGRRFKKKLQLFSKEQ